MIPNYYLEYYYYTARKLAEQEKWPPSRGEQVIEIEKELLKDYADPKLAEASCWPDEARRRVLLYGGDAAAQRALQQPG